VARDIWERNESQSLPRAHWLRAKALLTIMHETQTLQDLRIHGEPPNIWLHKLTGDRQGYWSVTIRLPSVPATVPGPTFSCARRSCSFATSASPTSSPTATATEIAMQGSPQEP